MALYSIYNTESLTLRSFVILEKESREEKNMAGKSNLNAKDVLGFFREADLDTAELILELGSERLKERQAVREKLGANLKKARAARKPKAATSSASGETQAQTATAAQGHQGHQGHQDTQNQASPIAAARARRAAAAGSIPSVPAPSHTAEATSVETDEVLS